MTDPQERSRAQFARTAAAYVESPTHAAGADLAQLVAAAGEVSGREVLDVATGAGHTALAFARAGARVTATDLTPEMLAVAETFVRAQGFGPEAVRFAAAPAEALPFAAERFDAVSCRIAAHHFAEPERFVSEAARVLRPGGSLLLVDNVAPELPELAAAMNEIERRRDPSHAEAYGAARWASWLAAAGLAPYHLSRWRVRKPFGAWLARAQTPPAEAERLEAYVLALPEPAQRYFRVEVQGGRVVALEHEAVLLASRKL